MAWEAKAVLFAELNKNHAQRIPINRVQSYSIDTALDTDSDSFYLELGDPFNQLHRLLMRDNEVRVNIFGGVTGNLEELQQGFADTVTITEAGSLLISGRDWSCLATDSTAKAHEQKGYRPDIAIRKEARALGFKEFALDKVPAIPKFYTDGSETYWEKWYRAYRKRKRWLWLEPNGTLRADTLLYTHKPTYRFGRPASGSGPNWIPVETCEFTTRKQGRVGIAQVVGQSNNIGVISTVIDKSIQAWVRRPFVIFQDDDVNSKKEARKMAFEEIFESKVGAIEIILTVMHPGFIIRQNRMAQVRIPEMGIDGNYFIVGNTITGGPEGAIQQVRLRQKGFAISRRVPDDPQLDKPPKAKVTGAMGEALNVRWGDGFVSAARKHHGPWPFDLWLATLLAICKAETGFRNVRYSGTVEWYPLNLGSSHPGGAKAIDRHHNLFANHINNPRNPLYPRSDAAVGPMQLVTRAFKEWADQSAGKRGEYDGGRWQPEHNIMAASRALAGKAAGVPVSQANLFMVCGSRYYGSSSSAANAAYSRKIRDYVLTDPGYLGIVRAAQQSAEEDLKTGGGGAWGGSKPIADQFRDVATNKFHLQVISAKRSTRNTKSGGMSDHYIGNKIAYAYDLSNSTHVTPQMDAFAREAVAMCGGRYNGKSELVFSKIIDGYRIQILYRTYVGGNHFNHVHVGVKKV